MSLAETDWRLDPLLLTTAAVAVFVLLNSAHWLVFMQKPGSVQQLVSQALVAIPVLFGGATGFARLRHTCWWFAPALAFLAAVPAVLSSWVQPPRVEGGCKAHGFLPYALGDSLQVSLESMTFVFATSSIVGGVLALRWPSTRRMAAWLFIAAVAQIGALFTSELCVGN